MMDGMIRSKKRRARALNRVILDNLRDPSPEARNRSDQAETELAALIAKRRRFRLTSDYYNPYGL